MMRTEHPIWIDTDPGVDDALALFVAAASPDLKVVGVSSVAGNVALDLTHKNARDLVALAGLTVDVHRGAAAPLIASPRHAPHVHGATGLGGAAPLMSSSRPEPSLGAVDALYEAIGHTPDLTLVCLGPLTNVALALAAHPDLATRLTRIVMMGGSASFGNVTPAAEFNIWFDAEAAARVVSSGIPLVMFGLDVTLQATLNRDDMTALRMRGGRQGAFIADAFSTVFDFVKRLGHDVVAMHDVCPLLYLIHPDLFTLHPAGVVVETQGRVTYGRTVVDLYSDFSYPEANVDVAVALNLDEMRRTFWALVDRFQAIAP